jgi:hypothetical protein
MSSFTRGLTLRGIACACAIAAVLVWSATGSTFGGLSARVGSTDTTGSATLLDAHTYAGGTTCTAVPGSKIIPSTSSFSCTGSITPTATRASGASSATDSITAGGSASATQVTQQVSLASCAPVQLANSAQATNPLLARYGTSFAPSVSATGFPTGAGAITLDGANPGGYESAVVSQTQPTARGSKYGLGIWFNTTSTTGGPLFGIGSSTSNATGLNDRILYMGASGSLSFVQNTTGTTTTTTGTYRDGKWHFAYVTLAPSLGSTTTTISVDGVTAATGGGIATGYSATTGYWHVGWSPVSGLPSYFTGALSDFVVFDTTPAPAAPTAPQRASQTAFTTWASAATELWPLNDTGTSTFSGTYPSGTANPCGSVNVGWSFAGPASCAWSPSSTTSSCSTTPTTSLTAAVTAGAQSIASPVPGATVISTVSTSRGAGYSTAFAPGLHLYAPITFTAKAGSWVNTFTWSDASAAFIA